MGASCQHQRLIHAWLPGCSTAVKGVEKAAMTHFSNLGYTAINLRQLKNVNIETEVKEYGKGFFHPLAQEAACRGTSFSSLHSAATA